MVCRKIIKRGEKMKSKRNDRTLIHDQVVTIKINKILKSNLQQLADSNGISVSSLIRMALIEYCKKNKEGRKI